MVVVHGGLERVLLGVVHRVVQPGAHHVEDGHLGLALHADQVQQEAAVLVPLVPLEPLGLAAEVGFHAHVAQPDQPLRGGGGTLAGSLDHGRFVCRGGGLTGAAPRERLPAGGSALRAAVWLPVRRGRL